MMFSSKCLVRTLILVFALSAPLVLARDDKGRGKGKFKQEKFEKFERREMREDRDNERFRRGHRERDDFAVLDARQRERIRHRGIDRNGDGIITRDEWPGNDVSFRRHDLNRDGVLSGSELQPGVRGRRFTDRDRGFDRRDVQFRSLDRNNDGVISLREWPGSLRDFERLDLNRDGVISRGEFFRFSNF